MIGWLHRHAEYRSLIKLDATALIEQFHDQAYSEARIRQHDAPDIVDAKRPAGHWQRVKDEIRRLRCAAGSTLASPPKEK